MKHTEKKTQTTVEAVIESKTAPTDQTVDEPTVDTKNTKSSTDSVVETAKEEQPLVKGQDKGRDAQETPEPVKPEAANKTPAPPVMPAQEKQAATWPGKLALVISIIALGGSGYQYWHSMQSQQQDSSTIDNLKQDVSKAVANVNTQLTDTKSVVSSQVASVNQNLTLLQSQSSKEQKGIEELQTRLTQSIQQVTAKQSNSRKDWLLAEVEYLLRLANQRILMENTSSGALSLLKSADKILKETDDVSIYAVRKTLASDIAALESVPTFDLEGSYLKLAALSEQINNLRLVPLTDKNKLPSLIEEISPEVMSETWSSGLKESWAKAVDKVEKLVVIQHRDEPIEPLLSPEQNYYLQQNLHLMLEQAQLALLQKNQIAFDRSLVKAEEWTGTYFEEKDATTQALIRGIAELKDLKISPEMPNISGSLNALKTYLQQVTKLKEEGAA
ncbi:uroporphyrinogen-III C-methyltransferase [Neptunomonas japonica]|uniref:uroporphyrinogen-III C-methyltransferase n=1 Tax=Neptunomonas japonica TaxID=417574 RepID=UPI0003F63383|nr:uroporphyrinogen-III C-methyltransferase [Neptunomonas japonica]